MFKKSFLYSLLFSSLLASGSSVFAGVVPAKPGKPNVAVPETVTKGKINKDKVSGEQAQNRALLRPTVIGIAKNRKHAHQRDAIRLLRDSHDASDQRLGLALQLQYFPPDYSKALQQKIAGFNLGTFKTHAPRSYASPVEGKKALAQMEEENLPDLLAALGPIVRDLGREQAPQISRANLVVALNGIIHCLTRQQEMINKTVRSLFYSHNNFENTIYIIVHEAIEQAILKAFDPKKISKAKIVIAAHIGASSVFEKLEKSLPRVDDAEIPGILEAFYQVFTPDYLTTYLLNRVQSAEDLQRAVETISEGAPLPEQVQRDRHERPILSGVVADWLMAKGQKKNLLDFGFDTIEGKGTLNKEGAQKILKMLAYVRG